MFIDDYEKVRDMIVMSKDDFLKSYSYLTKEEYDATYNYIMAKFFPIPCSSMEEPLYKGEKACKIEGQYHYWYDHGRREPVEVIYNSLNHIMTYRYFVKEEPEGNFIYGPALDECLWEECD